jgi:hypothetical protein
MLVVGVYARYKCSTGMGGHNKALKLTGHAIGGFSCFKLTPA